MTINNNFPAVFEDKISSEYSPESEKMGDNLARSRSLELKETPIKGNYTIQHLSKIHKHLFQDVSSVAGVVRNYNMNKGSTEFARAGFQLKDLVKKGLPRRIDALKHSVTSQDDYISAITELHSTLDYAHPFREGNGRSTRELLSQHGKEHGYILDFSKVNKEKWVEASINSIATGKEVLKRPIFANVIGPIK